MVFDFNVIVDRFLERENRPKGVGRYYPSEIGSCLRKTWYSYKFPQDVEPELMRIFEMGDILHDFVVNVLKSEKTSEVKLLETEVPVKMKVDDFVISGRVDDLLLIQESGKSLIVEVKSTSNVDVIREPAVQNVRQLQFYMLATGIHNGALLYIDKRNLKSKVFEIEFSKKDAEEVIERFRLLHKSLASGEVPPPEAVHDERISWMCRYCEYSDRCENC